jgi:hypothetical protein
MKKDIVGLLGNRSAMLVFQFFMNRPYNDYSLAEVERGVSMSYVSVRNGFRELVSNKVIVKSRQVGRAKLYKLNENSEIVGGLRLIHRALKQRRFHGKRH